MDEILREIAAAWRVVRLTIIERNGRRARVPGDSAPGVGRVGDLTRLIIMTVRCRRSWRSAAPARVIAAEQDVVSGPR
jgi:hypothetical protein